MKKLFIALVGFFAYHAVIAQVEDESCLPPSKKVQKLIDAAWNSDDVKTASDNFLAAIEADEDNATAPYEYAMYAYQKALEYYDKYPNPAMGDKSFQKAEELFEKTIELCSDYHGVCYYNLGVINYTQKDMPTAVKWFKLFLNYKHSDPGHYPENYDKMVSDVKATLEKLEREVVVKSTIVPFEPVIVKNVSSAKEEYFPMISPDNELMFFTRKLEADTIGFTGQGLVEKFTIAQRINMVSPFDKGKELPKPFNDGRFQSYGAATMSVDNKEMIFCACQKTQTASGQPYMNCDLYVSTFERTGKGGNDYIWTEPENLGTAINTPFGWEGQPTMSADGNTLYFTTNRPGSKDNDIYYSQRKADGSWGIAEPFEVINTAGKDKSPFLHQDSETLYFVSQVTKERPGVGGLDIYYIRQDESGKWSEPKNIGYPINSESDELGLFVSIDGKTAYFSSFEGGNWNIYSFELYEEARPKAVAILKGELKDEAGEPVTDATIEIAYEGTEEVTKVKVNGNDGKYAAIVKTEVKQDIMVTVQKEGHAFDSKLISKEELPQKTEDVAIRGNDLNVKELRVGEAYTINDILYATNSYTLTNRSKFILRGFAKFLKENPTIVVAINGHTDDVGEDDVNQLLSENRAKGVRDYLVSLGIDASRLKSNGFGETQPKVANESDVSRAINRRTDFVIEGM